MCSHSCRAIDLVTVRNKTTRTCKIRCSLSDNVMSDVVAHQVFERRHTEEISKLFEK